jgi:hypothetical protein
MPQFTRVKFGLVENKIYESNAVSWNLQRHFNEI